MTWICPARHSPKEASEPAPQHGPTTQRTRGLREQERVSTMNDAQEMAKAIEGKSHGPCAARKVSGSGCDRGVHRERVDLKQPAST